MSKYVKSYSNYVLKTKHQETNDGIIYERDITTIGGRDHFAAGQIPIYKSGNFVITVNNENSTYKKTVLQNWEGNESGDIWTLDILKNYEKDEKSSYDEKIVIKKMLAPVLELLVILLFFLMVILYHVVLIVMVL